MQRTAGRRAVLALAVLGLAVGTLVAAAGVPRPAGALSAPMAATSAPATSVGPTAPTVPARCGPVGAYEPPAVSAVGLPADLRLCPTGPLVVRTPGTLVDGLDITGGVVVDAADVVIRRSRITGDGSHPFGVATTPAGSVRVEDTTVTGDFGEAGIGGDRWTAERVEITRVTRSAARLGDGATLRNSWLHDLAEAPGAQTPAVELAPRSGAALIEGNRVDAGPERPAALRLAGPVDRWGPEVIVRNNVLRGGRITLHQQGGAGDPVRILGNRFGRDAIEAPLRVAPVAVVDGNTYVDGGTVRGS